MGDRKIPGCEPQPPLKFVLEITLGPDLSTPGGVRHAIDRALVRYGADHKGTVTPFDQQPGFPAGYIVTESGRRAGEWRITS